MREVIIKLTNNYSQELANKLFFSANNLYYIMAHENCINWITLCHYLLPENPQLCTVIGDVTKFGYSKDAFIYFILCTRFARKC